MRFSSFRIHARPAAVFVAMVLLVAPALRAQSAPPEELPADCWAPPMEIFAGVTEPFDGNFGATLDVADVTGDGLPDLIIGHRRVSPSRPGGVNLHVGSPAGLSPAFTMRVESPFLNDCFGGHLAAVGDVDADGFGDVVMSARRERYGGGAACKSVWLLRGGPSGFVEAIDWTALSGIHATTAEGMGDIDGDGHADVVLATAPGPGRNDTVPITLAVIRGMPGGLETTPFQVVTPPPDWGLGQDLVGGTDIDGDGRLDLIATGVDYDALPDLHRAAVFLGTPAGLATTPCYLQEGGDIGVDGEGPVDFAPDLNGDGLPEFVVGEWRHDDPPPGLGDGLVKIRSGMAGGVASSPWLTLRGAPRLLEVGKIVVPVGDVDGDGQRDLVIYARRILQGPLGLAFNGALLLHPGIPGGIADLPTRYGVVRPGILFDDIVAARAADWNGDGYSDVVIGTPSRQRVLVFFGSPPNTPPTCTSEPLITGSCLGTLLRATAADAEDTLLRAQWTTTCTGTRFSPAPDVLEPVVTFDPYCAIDCELVLTVRDQRCASATSTTRVRFADMDPPVIAGVPADAVVACDAVPPPATATAIDGCDSAPLLSFTEQRVEGSCPWEYELLRSWQAVDACGNLAEKSQSVHVVDTEPPTVTPLPAFSACLWPPNGRLETFSLDQFTVVVADACDPAPTWRFAGVVTEESGAMVDPADGSVALGGASVTLRVRRSGSAESGRHYRILAVGRDACGNESAPIQVGLIRVPHDARPGDRCR